jgi:hypothetical protein
MGYVYKTHFFPHDGDNTEWGEGKTRRAIASDEYKMQVRVLTRLDVSSQISFTRTLLERNAYFNKKTCNFALECVRSATYDFSERENVFKSKDIKHDEYSHITKAFIYAAMAYNKQYKSDKDRIMTPAERLDREAEKQNDIFKQINDMAGKIRFTEDDI